MRKAYVAAVAASIAFAAFSTVTAQPAQAQTPQAQVGVTVEVGKPIYSADGAKLGAIYKVAKDGAPQVIVSGKLVTVPAASVSVSGDRFVTTLTKKDIMTKR